MHKWHDGLVLQENKGIPSSSTLPSPNFHHAFSPRLSNLDMDCPLLVETFEVIHLAETSTFQSPLAEWQSSTDDRK